MDPVIAVGLVGTSFQLVGLAVDVIKAICGYASEIKEFPRRSTELRTEVAIMSGLVTNLEITVKTFPSSAGSLSFSLGETLKLSIETLLDILSRMNATIGPSKVTVIKRLQWPFKSDEIKGYTERISRYNGMLISVLNVQQLYEPDGIPLTLVKCYIGLMIKCKHSQIPQTKSIWAIWVFPDTFIVMGLVNSATEAKEILEWLCPATINPGDNQQRLRKLAVEQTATWVFKHAAYEQWRSEAGRFLWLYGKGKLHLFL
jgi:hypothetical protein